VDDHEHISNGIQKFDGRNYAYWSDRVKTYLTALGVDIWYSVVNGYVIANNAPIDPNEKNLMSLNSTLLKRYGTKSRISTKVIQKLSRSSFNDIEQNLKI
jgi:hypothetical protein